ncbi:cobalt-precorrin-5B (C1)-methyltransferase [Pseudomonas duriflava]|uniref:Cobalt-precorrin-5B C(1)-methyltransferase n=1 Tax=Pseudomonas duriflava TaxID=459528 RepID=A0A562Q2V5_9PSED|nr:cobalt-precorrin-5B (C(1))-methyltransferase [Pseudomonas duriflava]TWI50992.1 cobalt-precorrin-5B (C1)-methyltransferase [Pseudomonas duriflava]
MREESPERKGPLRSGFTTGSCATVTSLAAARLLLLNETSDALSIDLPKGNKQLLLRLEHCGRTPRGASASIIKDAGDDPDVTHGARVSAEVELHPLSGITFRAGPGVGTVTRPGLVLAVGEPAINPVPRQMMHLHLERLAQETGYSGGFIVTIGIEHGEALALKTMNPRLGILGGLSILGTSGIVRPFSCAAYIASIQQAIDVARANGQAHLSACTGNASEMAMRTHFNLPEIALIEMGDFVGAVLKHLKRAPVERLSLCGGFGKISKLAAGHMDLHSRSSSIDLPWLAKQAASLGADASLQQAMTACTTSQQALGMAHKAGLPLADHICQLAWNVAREKLPASIALDVFAINRAGLLMGCAS